VKALGLTVAEARTTVRSIRAIGTIDSDETVRDEVLARAAWSTIAEPGDGAAGGVVGILGASAALGALRNDWSAHRVATAAHDRADADTAEAVGAAWRSGVARWRSRFDPATVLHDIELAARTGVRLLCPGDAAWPTRIDDLGIHRPLALWVKSAENGPPSLDRSIGLVGARAATGYGEHVALESSSGLVDRGFVIVSGAAYGIDGMAHRSALGSGGTTVAFLAGGLDRPYPSGHSSLIARIADSGAVYSEVPCGAAPTKWRFLQRNRLIAASSAATVVLEAGRRSGSLNTAGHAASLGRPLGAVPGPVTSAASAGCHRLLREYDAVCVTTAAEMAELVDGVGQGDTSGAAPERMGPIAARVSAELRPANPSTVETLVLRTGATIAEVHSALGLLEMEGLALESAGGWLGIGGGGDRPMR
jgi:DNA processing protein